MGELNDGWERRNNQKIPEPPPKKSRTEAKQGKRELIEKYNFEESVLRALKNRLKPLYDELKREPSAFFLLPNIRPLHVSRPFKGDKPQLICRYGSAHSDKRRTIITFDKSLGDDAFTIQDQVYKRNINPGGTIGGESSDKFWQQDHDPVQVNQDGAYQTMKENLTDALGNYKLAAPDRVRGIAKFTAVALVVSLGLSQCNNSDASELHEPEDGTPSSELNHHLDM